MATTVNFKGSPMTLVGRKLEVLGRAPDFKVVSAELKDCGLKDFKGKVKVITSFLSLDTPVCDLQVKEFNKRAALFSSEVLVLAISKDLPFAQKRFCSGNDIKNITVLSDYKYSSFGINYGLLVEELNLLARAVLVLDKQDIIRYIQVVDELTHAPDYEESLRELDKVIREPLVIPQQDEPGKCKPCEAGTPPLPKETVEKLLVQHRQWQLVEDKKLVKEFRFKDFVQTKYFLDLVSSLAEEQGHHPVMTISYNKLKVTLTTHASGGLTENDFIMAELIDGLVLT